MKKSFFLLVLLTACTSGGQVVVNQLGYYPGQEKIAIVDASFPVSYTHLRAHETVLDLVCRLLLEKKK